MPTPSPIELLRVSGTHREVGRQIGEACAEIVRHNIEFGPSVLGSRSREDLLDQAAGYRSVTQAGLPWVVEEMDGVAEGAGVDPLVLFAASLDEAFVAPPGRCTDLVAAPPLSADGHLLVAHNNDLYPNNEEQLIAIERTVPGDPVVFTIGIGPWPSAGWNSAGLSFTGNELTPNDARVGIPLTLQFRAMLAQTDIDSAVREALRPDRASSYNNLVAASNGRVVNIEGSATDAELTGPDEHGALAHTNHYACKRMLPYEGDTEYAKHSAVRLARAQGLLASAAPASVTTERMREFLSDHENRPDSLCRHPEFGDSESKTVFWTVVDVTDMRLLYGRGNPCDSTEQEYHF